MTQEEKDLLLKDLCVRLPYGVKCYIPEADAVRTLGTIQYDDEDTLFDFWNESKTRFEHQLYVSEFKPYLFPMSSMTEEQKKEFIHCAGYDVEESVNGRHYEYYLKDYVGTPETPLCNYDAIDWLNAHHFDYRGLIEKNLALEAPENMYINNSKTMI